MSIEFEMDLLHYVLESLKVHDSSLALFHLRRPWGFQRAPMLADMTVAFTPVTGRCLLRMGDGRQAALEPGDTGLILGGNFSFQSAEDASLQPFVESWSLQQQPAMGPRVGRTAPDHFRWPICARDGVDEEVETDRLLAVAMLVDDVARSPVLGMLPSLLVVRRDQLTIDWPLVLQQFIESELAQPQPGYKAAAQHLSTLFFVTLLRTHVLQAGVQHAGWMRGMTDRAVGRALALMHAEFSEPWTLSTLSRACGMSRTNFAQRFNRLVGRTPMEYLTAVRMQAAAQLLKNGKPISSVCDAVGYGSPWAFRRAFFRQRGQTPSEYVNAATS